MDLNAVSAQYAQRTQRTLDLAHKVPVERREEPGVVGHWSLKDVMAHLAYWDGVTRRELEAERDDRPIESDDRHEDVINAEASQARADWTWEQVMAELYDNRDARIELHKLVSKQDMSEAGGHWEDHRAQIEAWIAKNL
jgi:hypothetical protein